MFRIIESKGEYIVQKRKFFVWITIKEWLGCDNLGFDYGWRKLTFSSFKEAKLYMYNNKINGRHETTTF